MNPKIDLIYFWSSLVLVALPLTAFSVLTYFVTKAYFRKLRAKEQGAGSGEQPPK